MLMLVQAMLVMQMQILQDQQVVKPPNLMQMQLDYQVVKPPILRLLKWK